MLFCRAALLLAVLPVTLAASQSHWRDYQPLVSHAKPRLPSGYSSTFSLSAHTYSHSADSAYMADRLTAEPLSSYFFNKSSFRLSEIFQNSTVPVNTENYNPFMRVLTFSPQALMTERGMHIGAAWRIQHPTSKRVRFSLKVSIPFKERQIKSSGVSSRSTAPSMDVVSSNYVSTGDANPKKATAYRLDFIEALPRDNNLNSALDLSLPDKSIVGTTVSKGTATTVPVTLISSTEGIPPRGQRLYASENVAGKSALPSTATQLSNNQSYYLDGAINYSTLADSAVKTVTQRQADQNIKAGLWAIPTFKSATELNDSSQTVFGGLAERADMYQSNPSEWFADRGYSLDSTSAVGFGDFECMGGIEYDLYDTVVIAVKGGIIGATADGTTSASNPYSIHLGHKGHTTLAIGGAAWWQQNALSLHGECMFYHVSKHRENLCATPIGSTIKNMGPATEAFVAWNYTTANVWLTLAHPELRHIQCSVGYEWYAKSSDTITFSTVPVESWLGKTHLAYPAGTTVFSTESRYLTVNDITVSKELAEANTRSVAHSAKVQFSYQPNTVMNVHLGGSYVFAGQHTPRVVEYSAGLSVRF